MFIRKFKACTSCDKGYFIRYGTSDQFPQKASFYCKNCGQKLSFGFDNNKKVIIENLKDIPEDESLEVIILHPELIIDPDRISDRYYFPTTEFIAKQAKKGNLEELRNSQASIITYNTLWDKIEKDLRLLSEDRYSLIDKKYGNENSVIEKRISNQISFISQHFISGKWKKILDDAITQLKLAKSKPKFVEFKNYLKNEFKDHIHTVYYVMNEYSKLRTEMLITLHSQKCEVPIEGISSSVEWDKIEMLYGNFYEKYGKLVSIITGISNLIERGEFNKFGKSGFTFDKYLETDKSGRCNNFIHNPKLKGFEDFYESNIRNGTHHKNTKIDKEKQEIILGVGKGGGNERKMSFVKYISYCNEIYARMLITFILYNKIVF